MAVNILVRMWYSPQATLPEIFLSCCSAKIFWFLAKPFALGVRVEHAQELIDSIQYKCDSREIFTTGILQFSFAGERTWCIFVLYVPGWSNCTCRNCEQRNGGEWLEFKCSKWSVFEQWHCCSSSTWKLEQYEAEGPLAALAFQSEIEQKAFNVVGSIQAPAQRLEDFIQNKNIVAFTKSYLRAGLTPRFEYCFTPLC